MGRQSIVSMTPEECTAYIANQRFGRLATVDREGQPHITPLAYVAWDNKVFIRGVRKSKRTRLLAQNPKVSFCIDDGVGEADGYADRRGVIITGECSVTEEIVSDQYAAIENLYQTQHGVSPDHLRRNSHIWLVITPTRYSTWDFSKIPSGVDSYLDADRERRS